MNKIYLLIFVFGIVIGAYFAGTRVATQKCNARIATVTAGAQKQIFQTMGDVNAETFSTGVRDIRRILREKYSIAE